MAIELVGALGVFGLTGTLTGLAPRPPVTPPAAGAADASPHRQRLRHDHEGRARRLAGCRRSERVRRERHRLRLGRAARRHGRLAAVRARGHPGVGASTLELVHHGDRWMGNGTQISIAGVLDDHGRRADVLIGDGDPADARHAIAGSAGDGRRRRQVSRTSTRSRTPAASRSRCTTIRERPGTDELHLTAFDADGNERPLARATMVAVAPDGKASSLATRRFSAGHFVGDLTLTAGRWTFFVQATTTMGESS